MAAGCTIAADQFETFDAALQQVARESLDPATLARTVLSDGPLGAEWFNAETVRALDAQVWGQAFEPPLFSDEVEVVSQRLVGDKHLKLAVRFLGDGRAGAMRDAIWFGHSEPLAATVRLAYRLGIDEYNGRERVQMVVEGAG
jgi:single-stranded-DNA-specific exonuclease